MSRESVTARGREFEQQGYTSRCTITRPGPKIFDPETGDYTFSDVEVYADICEFRFQDAQPREIDGQAQQFTEQRPQLKLPVIGSEGVAVDDVAVIDESDDVALVGLRMRIAGLDGKTYAVARRLPVEVLT